MNQLPPAKLRSRLLAITYDFLIILFISTIAVLIIQLALIGNKELPADHFLNTLLKPIWFIPGFLYLGYYWTKNGQTPSMKVWKIKVVNLDGGQITWLQALLRYIFSLLGLGVIYCFFNKERNGTQDLISKTRLIRTDVQTTSIE